MPITIREILASDTISGAADKINFNFDQLLLNGGGPPGPPGPQGPIGPIGGRGIRGSVWYEGVNSPITTPPTLTPEEEDNYLQANGDVWTYIGGAWFNTSINLTGPTGPSGAGGKFSEYQVIPYTAAGDTTLYPTSMTFSADGVNRGVKSVIIGGLPSGLGNPTTGDEIIIPSLATFITQPTVSLFVHQFDSSGGGIKFHGGNALIDNFTNIITDLTEIRLLNDDKLFINVPKAATGPSSPADVDGLVVSTTNRGQLYQSGKRIQFQTGGSAVSYGLGDTSDFIVDAARSGSGSNPTIQLNVLGTTSAPTASFRLGDTGTAPLPPQTGDARLGAGLITIDGSTSITATSPLITLSGGQTNIYAGTTLPVGAAGRVTIGASTQIVMRTVNAASTGAISIGTGNATTGNISIATGNSATGNIVISTGVGTSGNVEARAATDFIVIANNEVDIFAANKVDIHSKDNNVNIYTNSGSGGDINVQTDNNGSSILVRTDGQNSPIGLRTISQGSPISLISNGNSSDILLQTTGLSEIKLDSLSVDIDAGFIVDIDSVGNINATAGGDINIRHGSGNSVTVIPSVGNSNALIEVKPLGTASRSTVNIFHAAGGGNTNLQLRSDGTNGGEISVSPGMRLRLTGGFPAPPAPQLLSATDAPSVVISGTNHYVHSTQITSPANNAILSSGLFTQTVSGRTVTINWQRVGNTVTCGGKIDAGSGILSAGASILYPIKSGTNVIHAYGTATAATSPTPTACHIENDGGNNFTWQGTGLLSPTELYFSFSYEITQ